MAEALKSDSERTEASYHHPLTPVDVGLQIERTTLSWRRTFLSGCVALAGILKTSLDLPSDWDTIIIVLASVALLALIFSGRSREDVYTRFEAVDKGETGYTVSVLHWGWALLLSVTLSAVGVIALITIIADAAH